MDHPVPPPEPPGYKDRHTGLIVFGVFEILIGAFCALLIPLAIFGQIVAARRHDMEMDAFTLLSAVLIYGLIAGAFVWLGIGSILARRWARTLLLCLGWIGLCVGLLALPVVWISLDSIGPQLAAQGRDLPAAGLLIVKLFSLGVVFIIYVVIPALLVLFYRSEHVRLTCEARDPVPRWTDRCPVPVLALCVIKAFSAVSLLCMLPRYGRAFPLMGTIVEGWPSRLLWLGMIAFMLYAVRGFFHLRRQVWRIYLAVAALLGLSQIVTFLRVDLLEFYRSAGLTERQLELLAQSPLITHHAVLPVYLGIMLAFYLGYLFFVGRYFPAATDRPAAA